MCRVRINRAAKRKLWGVFWCVSIYYILYERNCFTWNSRTLSSLSEFFYGSCSCAISWLEILEGTFALVSMLVFPFLVVLLVLGPMLCFSFCLGSLVFSPNFLW